MDENCTNIWYSLLVANNCNNYHNNHITGISLSEKDEQALMVFTKYRFILLLFAIIIALITIIYIRYNTQRDDSLSVDRGPHQQIPIEQYQPGLFNVSGFRPILPSTREMLGISLYHQL